MGNKNKRITPRFRIETSIDPELASLKQINKDFWELKTVLPDGTKATIKDKVLNSGEGWVEFAMGHNPTTFAKMEDAGIGYTVYDQDKPKSSTMLGLDGGIVFNVTVRAEDHIPEEFVVPSITITEVNEPAQPQAPVQPTPEVKEAIDVEPPKESKEDNATIAHPLPQAPKETNKSGPSFGCKLVKVVAIGAATGWLLYRTVKFIMDDEV